MSGPELAAAALHKSPIVREALATRADAPLGLLLSLAQDGVPEVRAAVAGNPRTLAAPSLVGLLLGDRDPRVLVALGRNPEADADILDYVRHHPDELVRRAFAASSPTSSTVAGARLHGLAPAPAADAGSPSAQDPSPGVRPVAPVQAPTRTAPVRGFRPPPSP